MRDSKTEQREPSSPQGGRRTRRGKSRQARLGPGLDSSLGMRAGPRWCGGLAISPSGLCTGCSLSLHTLSPSLPLLWDLQNTIR